MLAIRLPTDIEQRIADLASRTGRTKTFYVLKKPSLSTWMRLNRSTLPWTD